MKDLNDEQLKNVTGGANINPNQIDMKSIEESECYKNCLQRRKCDSEAVQRECRNECLSFITKV